MRSYIKPECMPYYYNSDGVIEFRKITQSIAYTSNGYLLPCCWCDSEFTHKDMTAFNMYKENLKLENNNTVEDILYSAEWKNFINIIMTDFNQSPSCCRLKCGVINE